MFEQGHHRFLVHFADVQAADFDEDAAERGRSDASTFVALRKGVRRASAIHLWHVERGYAPTAARNPGQLSNVTSAMGELALGTSTATSQFLVPPPRRPTRSRRACSTRRSARRTLSTISSRRSSDCG